MCKDCSFCNRTFKVRSSQNINKEKVTFQSLFEKQLIDFCNDNNILIKDGPNVQYKWDGKRRRYKVDFYIPSHEMIVEIKDNHYWHKKQVESGKWHAKFSAAQEYSNKEKLNFELVFPKDFQKIKDKLLNNI